VSEAVVAQSAVPDPPSEVIAGIGLATNTEPPELVLADFTSKIRIATPNDYQEMFRLCCLLHRENAVHKFNELKVRSLVWRAVNQDSAIAAVIGRSDDIKAMILMTLEEIVYSDSFELVERWNYVRPDSRKSNYAKQMIGFAKKCADETGLILAIGIISEKKLEAKRRLYERMLPLSGYWFIYKPPSFAIAAA
jgi:GNAT superfamily N-acetyltransferase